MNDDAGRARKRGVEEALRRRVRIGEREGFENGYSGNEIRESVAWKIMFEVGDLEREEFENRYSGNELRERLTWKRVLEIGDWGNGNNTEEKS